MERVTGIGPVSQPWEGRVLPLNYTRTSAQAGVIRRSSLDNCYLLLLCFLFRKNRQIFAITDSIRIF